MSEPAPVLVGVDLSPCSWRVVRGAIQLARPERRPVRIVYVLPPRGLRASPAEVEGVAIRRLGELGRLARQEGVEVQTALLRGDPASTLLAEGRRVGAVRLVVGSHRRGLGQRLLHGSVSSRLMRSARVPVSCIWFERDPGCEAPSCADCVLGVQDERPFLGTDGA